MKATRAAIKALKEHRITGVKVIEGRPGGPNNDRLDLKLDDGRVVRIDSYAHYGMTVKMARGS